MHIKSVEFAGAIGQVGQPAPDAIEGLPQVAFSGRSNVGKSSLINRVLGRTRTPLARVSGTPGKTQEVNFYRVRSDAGDFALVDLPGYGFAKAPADARENWRRVIDDFLSRSTGLKGVVQLIDIRHGPTKDDMRAIAYLSELGLPILFVLTKADKLRPQKRDAAFASIVGELMAEEAQTLAVSALSGAGVEDLLETIGSLVRNGPDGTDSSEGG